MRLFLVILQMLGYLFWLGSLVSIIIVLPLLQIHLDRDLTKKMGKSFLQKTSSYIYLSGAIILLTNLFNEGSGRRDLSFLRFFTFEINLFLNLFIVFASGLLLFLGRRIKGTLDGDKVKIATLIKQMSTYHSASIFILLMAFLYFTLRLLNYQ